MPSDRARRLLALYQAYNERGIDELYANWWAEGIEWHDAAELPDAGVHRGRDAAYRALHSQIAAVGEFQVEVVELHESDRDADVVAVWQLRGAGPHSGAPVTALIVHACTIDASGKLARLRQWLDPGRAERELGIEIGARRA